MGASTKIQWCDRTFSPWIGCQRVSPGCEHCYAEAYDKRVGGAVDLHGEKQLRWGPKAPRIRTSAENWRTPLRWNRQAAASKVRDRVFCSSLADVFEDRAELVPWRYDLWSLISATPNLDWLLLTKRPHLIALNWPGIYHPQNQGVFQDCPRPGADRWPNVWLGTTVEDQDRADTRVRQLLEVPAVVHFLSCEPLLERIRLPKVRGLDWIIIGGESGPGARPFNLDWALDLMSQAADLGAKVFVKQLGSGPLGLRLKIRSGAGSDPSEWPAALRVREWPR